MKKQLIHVTRARTTRSQVWEGYNENKLFLEEFQAAWHDFLGALKPEHVVSFDEEIEDKLRPDSEFRYYLLR